MSLGIKLSWRARPRRLGLSLIPRGSFLQSTQPRSMLQTRQPTRLQSTAGSRSPDSSVPTPTPSRTVASRKADSNAAEEDAADAAVLRLGQSKSVLVEPSYIYPNKAETHRSQRRHHQSVTRQMRLEQIRIRQRKPLPDWRAILQQLTAWTPERSADWQADAVKIILPKETAREMLSGVDNNVWAIRRRTGCAMKLYQGDGEDGSSSVVLSGSEASLNKAAEEILRVAKKATVIRLPETPEGPNAEAEEADMAQSTNASQETRKAIINAPWKEGRRLTRPYTLKSSVHDIAKPSEWTKESFEQYVSALVNARVPDHLLSKVYPAGTTHDKTVISLLHSAFNDEATRTSLSTSAFKLALAFMCRKGHPYRPDARALFVRMELFGLRMDTEVFNILLQSTVKVRDLRNFDTTVRLMVGRGHAPDLDTWVLFLRIIDSEDVKRYILHAMASKGLLRTQSALRRVARELAAHDADRAFAPTTTVQAQAQAQSQGRDLQTFLADQEARYGAGWLTRDAGNRIMDVLGRFGRSDDCLALLDVMAAAGPASRPDVVTLNTILTHAKVRGSLRGVPEALHKIEQLQGDTARPRVRPDATTYHLLFEIAWRRRLPHVIGVVWRYAALERLTSYRMRRRVSQLLGGQLSPSTTKKLGRLTGDAGSYAPSAAAGAIVDGKTMQALIANDGKAAQNLGSVVSKWYQEYYRDWEPDVGLGTMFESALQRELETPQGTKAGEEKEDAPELAQRRPLTLRLRPKERAGELPKISQPEESGEEPAFKIRRIPDRKHLVI